MLSTKSQSVERDLASQVIGDLPSWGVPYATDLLQTLTSTEAPFPCTFAVSAAKKAGLRFGFIDDEHDRRGREVLPDIIRQYLEVYRSISRETSLIVLFRPGQEETGKVGDYYQKFWDVLQFLHEHDSEAWPAEIPKDTDDKHWEFSFGGTPVFVVCNTPAHTARKSRSNPCFMITFQPRWVFEDLDPTTSRGWAARRVIRNRLRAFDGLEPSPELGNYGDPENREWRQYFLFEENDAKAPACPFRHT
ncbi:YqcI/YcgG family protein [Streptomyces sp. NBC_00893]|uniref:YqcI/YcgG family protein n=1 Tax=Streptomyces sp. NBC_00893 TaxID=2975862 RepID=UPI0022556C1D|nr:YqcI/YcgG family protein [Streptomyces sp. NBC_00893]MCX4849518.1 YqcI/YcgG family protein [Streptomyces sp. NBC_00893]